MQAVDGVSFELARGEILAVVGGSGCGKSVTAMTLMGLTRRQTRALRGLGPLRAHGADTATDDELRAIRGAEIAMIFQDPMTSLNPVIKIGDQIIEQIRSISASQASRRGSGRSSCSSALASHARATGSIRIRSSSRAACASG